MTSHLSYSANPSFNIVNLVTGTGLKERITDVWLVGETTGSANDQGVRIQRDERG